MLRLPLRRRVVSILALLPLPASAPARSHYVAIMKTRILDSLFRLSVTTLTWSLFFFFFGNKKKNTVNDGWEEGYSHPKIEVLNRSLHVARLGITCRFPYEKAHSKLNSEKDNTEAPLRSLSALVLRRASGEVTQAFRRYNHAHSGFT